MRCKYYHYVPPCPRCGSKQTGRFILDKYESAGFARYLKRGELVCSKYYNDGLNLFCSECGVCWKGEVTTKFITPEELRQEKIDRDILDEDYKNKLQMYKEDKRNVKIEKGKMKNVFRKIRKQFNFR